MLCYRLLNETHIDELSESYKIDNNKLNVLNGHFLRGRDYKPSDKFIRYNFQKSAAGFSFKNDNSEDSEGIDEMFDIANNDLSDNLQISTKLSPKSYSFVDDLMKFHRKMINFVNGLAEEDKHVFYYHHNGDGTISLVQFWEWENGYLGSIHFELKSSGSISGGYVCDIQTQNFNIENGKVVLQGEVRTTGAYK